MTDDDVTPGMMTDVDVTPGMDHSDGAHRAWTTVTEHTGHDGRDQDDTGHDGRDQDDTGHGPQEQEDRAWTTGAGRPGMKDGM